MTRATPIIRRTATFILELLPNRRPHCGPRLLQRTNPYSTRLKWQHKHFVRIIPRNNVYSGGSIDPLWGQNEQREWLRQIEWRPAHRLTESRGNQGHPPGPSFAGSHCGTKGGWPAQGGHRPRDAVCVGRERHARFAPGSRGVDMLSWKPQIPWKGNGRENRGVRPPLLKALAASLSRW